MAATGINFRATSGYVTDGADETYSLGGTYPVTRDDLTFGWNVTADLSRDRNSSLDRRLAGAHVLFLANARTFRVDLPATGNYDLRLALGDASFGGKITASIFDDSTLLYSIPLTQYSAANWLDAEGTIWSAAAWPGSNVAKPLTFASTILKITLSGASDISGSISHLSIVASAGGGFVPFPRPRGLNGGMTGGMY